MPSKTKISVQVHKVQFDKYLESVRQAGITINTQNLYSGTFRYTTDYSVGSDDHYQLIGTAWWSHDKSKWCFIICVYIPETI